MSKVRFCGSSTPQEKPVEEKSASKKDKEKKEKTDKGDKSPSKKDGKEKKEKVSKKEKKDLVRASGTECGTLAFQVLP